MALATTSRRVAALEAATGSGAGGDGFPPCPDCGWRGSPDGDHDHGPYDTYEIVFSDGSEEPTYCETCGEAIPEVVVTWGDTP